MRKIIIRKKVLPITLLLSLLLLPVLRTQSESEENPPPFFLVSYIVPSTCPARNQWPEPIAEVLEKIGIGIDVFEDMGWGLIYSRTWDYPGPYPIPTYAEGGFDILFVGWGGSLDWDPTGLFETTAWPPEGDNLHQYSNPVYDVTLEEYIETYLAADRIEPAKQLQQILYEDLPTITIFYPRSLYTMGEDVSGLDGLLWLSSYQPMELWSNGNDAELHYGTPADFVDMHPLLYASKYDAQWLHQIYNGLLIRENGTRGWTERLVTSYNTSDGLTWTFELDPNAKWADGTPLTTEDIIFTYQSMLTPELQCWCYSFLAQYLDNESITSPSNDTVQFVLKQPYTFAENLLAYPLIPKHIWDSIPFESWEDTAIDWAENNPERIFGAGPYKLHNSDPVNGIIHLKKNPYFANLTNFAEPIFKDIYFEFYNNKEGVLSALAAGTIDMVDAQFMPMFEELEGINNIRCLLVPDPGTQEMALNNLHPYFGTGEHCPIAGPESARHVRKAMSHMISREDYINEILKGFGAPGVTPFSDGSFGFDETLEPYEYSIELAKDHMRAAGFEYPEDPGTATICIGLRSALPILLGILGLVGGSMIIIRRKEVNI